MNIKWSERREATQTNWDNWSRDRARIIHSASFRRLQGKTQVLGVGENDFYRTRLTHSLEVAQICSGIVAHLSKKYKNDNTIYKNLPEPNLIEAIGLAHDIGHPPFGHKGEVALYKKMKKFGGFEGNGQTLRICSLLGEASEENGLNLTRRTLLGLLKYPALNKELMASENQSVKPPKCILDTEEDILNWILEPLTERDRRKFRSVRQEQKKENGKTIYKSFDCSIMELADDIAYAVHDLEDAIALKIITIDDYRSWYKGTRLQDKYKPLEDDLFGGKHSKRKKVISTLVHEFIDNVEIKHQGIFEESLIDLNAITPKSIGEEIQKLKDLTYNNVIKKYEIKTLEFKGGKIIEELFDTINENENELLPEKYLEMIKSNPGVSKERFICDFIAGMTDNYASSLYDRLFTTNMGSIFTKL